MCPPGVEHAVKADRGAGGRHRCSSDGSGVVVRYRKLHLFAEGINALSPATWACRCSRPAGASPGSASATTRGFVEAVRILALRGTSPQAENIRLPTERQPDPTAGDWTASAVNTSRQMPQPDTPDAQTRRSRAVSGHAPNGSARCRGLTRRPDGSDAADCGMMTPWPSSGLVADADHPASPRGAAAQFLQSKPGQLFLQTLRLLQGRVDCPENDSPGVVLTCSAGRPPEPGLPGRAFCDR